MHQPAYQHIFVFVFNNNNQPCVSGCATIKYLRWQQQQLICNTLYTHSQQRDASLKFGIIPLNHMFSFCVFFRFFFLFFLTLWFLVSLHNVDHVKIKLQSVVNCTHSALTKWHTHLKHICSQTRFHRSLTYNLSIHV